MLKCARRTNRGKRRFAVAGLEAVKAIVGTDSKFEHSDD